MSYNTDIQDLIELGLNADRLAKQSDEDIKMAMCAVQESGNDLEMIAEMGDEAAAAMYAESALGW